MSRAERVGFLSATEVRELGRRRVAGEDVEDVFAETSFDVLGRERD